MLIGCLRRPGDFPLVTFETDSGDTLDTIWRLEGVGARHRALLGGRKGLVKVIISDLDSGFAATHVLGSEPTDRSQS